MQRPRWNERGLCLLETMVALAAGAMVLSATIQALSHFERRLWGQLDTMARHQDLRIGMRIMEEELRLAGTSTALPEAGPSTAVLNAGSQEIVFAANLDGLTATVTQPAVPGQQGLTVNDGSAWPKGKQIVVCGGEHCAESRLARDGRSTSLSLTGPLGHAFPVGSTVAVSNQVRYYLKQDGRGRATLMRQVDGGANTLVGDVASFRLRYVDREGMPTQEPARVARVRMELAVGDGGRVFVSEVGFRAT